MLFLVVEVENFVWLFYVYIEFELIDKFDLMFGLCYIYDEKCLFSLIVGNFDNILCLYGFFWDKENFFVVFVEYLLCDLDGDGNLFSGGILDNWGILCC